MGSPERGAFIPISETKPFKSPEAKNAGVVGVLDKPKETEDVVRIGYLPSPTMIEIPINEKNSSFTSDGKRIGPVILSNSTVEAAQPKKNVKAGNTSIHEGAHTLLALEEGIGVELVTRVPEGDTLGSTHPDAFSAVAAAGGKASDTGGWSWDEAQVEARGMSFGKAETRARAKLRELRDVHDALSSAIEERGTLTRSEINEVYRNAKNVRKQKTTNNVVYEVPIKEKNGREVTVRLEVPKGATMLHVPLPKSGDIYDAKRDNFYSESPKDF